MDETLTRLSGLNSCLVSDACDQLGLTDRVVIGIANLTGTESLVGRVMTVLLGPPRPEPATRHATTAAIDAATEGEVIVVAHQGRADCAGWGGILARAASAQGLAGTIVDGATRDVDEAREIGYTVYASAATPRTARGRAQEHDWNCPVDISGVRVNSGDYVVADSSGIVFIEAESVTEVVRVAEAIAARESEIVEETARGGPVSDTMAAPYEMMLHEGHL